MYKKILTIQDISCVGQCSITTALPILSACGIETCILPTALLSTHTGGFKNFTFRGLSSDIPSIIAHWKSENIKFDAVYTGYLGSCDDVKYVIDIADSLLETNSLLIVDPAMADNGKLYTGFDTDYVNAMKKLCEKADVILPNITESCILLDTSCPDTVTDDCVNKIAVELRKRFDTDVVITDVSFNASETGVYIYTDTLKFYYNHKRIERNYHGTGDVFASAFVGSLMCGKTITDASEIAADYVLKCIENTVDDEKHWYGVKFETALDYLRERLK